MDVDQRMEAFLEAGPYAVAGASADREKYGNKVLRVYLQDERGPLYAINPKGGEIEGVQAYPDLASLPEPPRSLSIITPPEITEQLVEDAARAGVEHVWMQPGAESARAIERAEELGLSVVAGGPCILVRLGYRE